MRVMLVSPSVVGGGAEKVATDLHREYLTRGVDSVLAVGSANRGVPACIEIPRDAYRGRWASRLLAPARHLDARSQGRRDAAWVSSRVLRTLAEPSRFVRTQQGYEDFDVPQTAHLLELITPPPRILHLHNLHGRYFDLRALPGLSTRIPTFYTLHDMWAFTGHCAYSLDCERWRVGCGDCPHLDIYVPIPRDRSAENRALKHAALRGSRLRISTPSHWLAELVEASGILGEHSELRVIPNGVDTTVFAPGDRQEAREQLGLPQDRTILLFAARSLRGSAFKGFGVLASALESIAHDARATDLLLVGLGEESSESHIAGIETRFLPFVDDPNDVARHYRAANLYVHPARAENLPLAIIESMACGTPVVASRVGGIPEIVVDGQTGLLSAVDDASALAEAVLSALSDPRRLEAFSAATSLEEAPMQSRRDLLRAAAGVGGVDMHGTARLT